MNCLKCIKPLTPNNTIDYESKYCDRCYNPPKNLLADEVKECPICDHPCNKIGLQNHIYRAHKEKFRKHPQ
jgi:hypothetical protein